MALVYDGVMFCFFVNVLPISYLFLKLLNYVRSLQVSLLNHHFTLAQNLLPFSTRA